MQRRYRTCLALVAVLAVVVMPTVRAEAHTTESFGALDTVTPQASGTAIALTGWALTADNPTTALAIRVKIDGVVQGGLWYANQYRPDVGATYPGTGNNHGFSFSVTASGGSHEICVEAQNTGYYDRISCASYSMGSASLPQGYLELNAAPTGTGAGAVHVVGWALTSDYPTTALAVRPRVDGQLPFGAGYFYANSYRSDVAAAFPAYGGSHGFDLNLVLPLGSHTVCMEALNGPSWNRIGSCVPYSGPNLPNGNCSAFAQALIDNTNSSGVVQTGVTGIIARIAHQLYSPTACGSGSWYRVSTTMLALGGTPPNAPAFIEVGWRQIAGSPNTTKLFVEWGDPTQGVIVDVQNLPCSFTPPTLLAPRFATWRIERASVIGSDSTWNVYLDCEDGVGYRQITPAGGGTTFLIKGYTSGWGVGEMEAKGGADRTNTHSWQLMIVSGSWTSVAGVTCRLAVDNFEPSAQGYRVALAPNGASAFRTDQSRSKWGCP